MKPQPSFALVLSALTAMILAPGCASSGKGTSAQSGGGGTAVVTFVNPDRYTDLQLSGMSRQQSSAMLIPDLERHIRQVAGASLPLGRALDVRIVDIDQAGYLRLVDARMIRVDLNSQPARIDLEFALHDGSGGVLKSGKKSLTAFSTPGRDTATWKDELTLLKRLLGEWIRGLAT